jgi:hypothetical protein
MTKSRVCWQDYRVAEQASAVYGVFLVISVLGLGELQAVDK